MFSKLEIEDLTQSQNEALITLLVLLYRADHKIKLNEQDYFQQVCDRMNWKSGTSLENFIPQVISDVRKKETTTILNEAVTPLIGYKEIIEILEEMAKADGDVSAVEKETLDKIRAFI